ncbi:hypothetical protein Ahu01nite_088140 [Winogradskya humida]|uniref:DUF397 domain-containing protein n=2 Tax=Winogradskya humida TaxID=113566 RepID=A0ABQ4A4C9_9ACTN|nr:hypothetical protein Ahu01nite_088140 [Actinoplanes humidus]
MSPLSVMSAGIHSLKGMTLQKNALTWRKSTRSGAAGHCVEVASVAAAVFVRDSKNVEGPMLEFGQAGWAEFVAGVRAGEFDR